MQARVPFFEADPGRDAAYEAVRDAPHLADVREFIECLWLRYELYADKHFLDDAKRQFHQRTWELYVGCVLLQQGFDINKVSNAGPEFFIEIGGEKIWIEAIAPEAGQGADSVPPLLFGAKIVQPTPEEQILLRFTHALSTKLEKYQADLQKGLIGPEDCYVIAINGYRALDGRADPGVPYVIKAVLAVGGLVVSFDPKGSEPDEVFYKRRTQVVKKGGTPVPTKAFLSAEYAGISGLLYSPRDIVNVKHPLGSEMFYLHNPLTKNPVHRGAFRFCREYWYSLETEQMEHRDWLKERQQKWSFHFALKW